MKLGLEKIVTEKLRNSNISADIAIQSIREFYENLKHPNTNTEENPNNDMLLFQYGTYDWSGAGPQFEFNVTRQIATSEEDEFYQFSLTLKYENNTDTSNIESYNLWSEDCESIEDWIAEIKTTEGYNAVLNLKPLAYTVDLNKT